jgi:hypothetical protein
MFCLLLEIRTQSQIRIRIIKKKKNITVLDPGSGTLVPAIGPCKRTQLVPAIGPCKRTQLITFTKLKRRYWFVPPHLSLELLQGLLHSVQLELFLRCSGGGVLQPLLQLFHLYTEYIKRFLKRTRYIKLLSNIFSVEGEKNNVADPK